MTAVTAVRGTGRGGEVAACLLQQLPRVRVRNFRLSWGPFTSYRAAAGAVLRPDADSNRRMWSWYILGTEECGLGSSWEEPQKP